MRTNARERRPRSGGAASGIRAIMTAGLLLCAPYADAWSQTTQQPHGLRLPAPPTEEFAARGARPAPAVSLGIPSGYGYHWGDAAVGIGFQATTRLHNRPDGIAALAFGIGNARDIVGLETVVASYGTVRTCCRGGISMKLHRVLPADFGVALGWENAVTWGSFEPTPAPATDAGSSVYGVVSRVFHVRPGLADPYRTLTLTLGAGNGRFRSESDIIAGRETVNVFGGAAMRFSRATSVVADWTGQDLTAGVSFMPLWDRPFVVMPGLADLTTSPRFILGAAYGFDYTSVFR